MNASTNNKLHHAAIAGDRKAIATCVAREGYDVNEPNHLGHSPLHLAVMNRNLAAVDELLIAGAQVNARDKQQRVPLHYAMAGEPEVIRRLMRAGADPKAEDIAGKTPALMAKDGPRPANAALLLGPDAKVMPSRLQPTSPSPAAALPRPRHLERSR